MSTLTPHPATLPIEKLLADCRLTFTRRSGPGGQHRNKTSTAVVIRHLPTGVEAEASERRSQAANRAVAIHRLRLKLAREIRVRRIAYQPPSELWRSRVHGERISVSSEHEDFPALLSEALDVIHSYDFDLRDAAADLECTSSQLTKFLQQDAEAFAFVNQERARLGMRRLK